MSCVIDLTGEIGYNNNGSRMTIIECMNHKNLTIRFDDGYIVDNIQYSNFKRGSVKNPYEKVIYNIGYPGVGKHKMKVHGKNIRKYDTWKDMLRRCYSEKRLNQFPSYRGCKVCDDWHNYQVFADWYDENYYEIEGKVIVLDKDILIKRNKIYSPETCVFVPTCINSLYTKSNSLRGDLPIGVAYDRHVGKYVVKCNDNKGNRVFLGYFKENQVAEAFNTYKNYKEKLIKNVADEYKNKYPQFPQKLYDAMYRYEVEITD